MKSKKNKFIQNAMEFGLKKNSKISIPITYKNKIICTIDLSVSGNPAALDSMENRLMYIRLLSDLRREDLIKKRLECYLKFIDITEEKCSKFDIFIYFAFAFSDWRFFYSPRVIFDEKDTFKLIRSCGPVSLCLSQSQDLINDWIKDEKIAHKKLKKVFDALVNYAYGNKSTMPFKQGRPESEEISLLGKHAILKIYRCMNFIFKEIKKDIKYYQLQELDNKTISRLIDKCYLKYLDNRMKELKEDCPSSELSMLSLAKSYCFYREQNPISFAIENYPSLKSELLNKIYAPHELAKKTCAKLLDISESKLLKIIYRQNNRP